MKKLFVLLIACAVVICAVTPLTACGRNESDDTNVVSSSLEEETTKEPTDDPTYDIITSNRFDTVGYYACAQPSKEDMEFFAASGIDTIQILDRTYMLNMCCEGFHDEYLDGFRQTIEYAHAAGVKVYVMYLSNLKQCYNTDGSKTSTGDILFNPANSTEMERRLSCIENSIKKLDNADGFTFFAGDPGGVSGTGNKGNINYYIEMAKKVYSYVQKYNPDAPFNLNIWAISQYVQNTADPFGSPFWIAEGTNGRKVIAMDDLLGPTIGIEIPCHDYYRPLAFRIYDKSHSWPEKLFPQASDIQSAKDKNTANIWSFCHFLLDELDDGDSSGNSRTSLPNINTRYIKQYIDNSRALGFDGCVAGSIGNDNMLNLYAFGRFSNDDKASEEQVIREFAGFLATEETADTLAEILKFVENDVNWEKKMPKKYRLDPLPTTVTSAENALELLEQVKFLPESERDGGFPLLMDPLAYLQNIKKRIKIMISNDLLIDEEIGKLTEDGKMWICKFEDDSCKTSPTSSNALHGLAGKLKVPCGKDGKDSYELFGVQTKKPYDFTEFSENGYIKFYVYADKAMPVYGYLQISADSSGSYEAGNANIYYINEDFSAGWNEVSFKLSDGAPYVSEITDWSAIYKWRTLLFNRTEEDITYIIDDMFLTNDEISEAPGC